jgi:hypothetical protein
MPFLLMRTASVLAAGFLMAGSSYAAPTAARASAPASTVAARGAASCPAHWTAAPLPVPALPAPAGRIQSVAALSLTDAWLLLNGAGKTGYEFDVYHLADGAWNYSVNLDANDNSIIALAIVARSDTDVWVIGEEAGSGQLRTWHYDGSAWTDHPPTPSSPVGIGLAAAVGSNGVLYVAGTTYKEGIVWSYDGSRWTDLTPPNPPLEYDAAAVAADGTLVVAGGAQAPVIPGEEQNDGTLQERSGSTWTTVSLSAPVDAITGVSVAPGGAVYAVGDATSTQPVLIELPPGGRSATVLDAPAVPPATSFPEETGVVAVGAGDVWLIGQYYRSGGAGDWYPWITHFDGSRFVVAQTPQYSSNDGALAGAAALGPAVLAYGADNSPDDPEFLAVCPVQVTRDALVPSHSRTAIGSQLFWSVPATAGSWHELVAPGMFDSGTVGPGGSFEEDLFAAATYAVRDTATGATETVRVPAAVTPASGVTSTVFTVTCASLQAPAGYAYRLLIERPGSAGYALLTTTHLPITTFLPYHGTGTYRFECQVQTPEGLTAASPPAAVTVSLSRRSVAAGAATSSETERKVAFLLRAARAAAATRQRARLRARTVRRY